MTITIFVHNFLIPNFSILRLMPRKTILYIVGFSLIIMGCSRTTLNMKNNSWATRTYHNTTSRYNIYFNGNEALMEGVAKIELQHQDDFSRVLPVSQDGMHETYASATAEMDYAIEKANKIIQLHSIKKKPKYNRKKASDPDYRAWRAQEEFNKMIDDAYMLLGKAAYYKGEFIESIGIFNHVAVKYAGEDPWYLAHLWMAKAYIEMGWLYESENMLALVNNDKLPYQYTQLFNLVNAHLLIKQGLNKDAVPYLKAALEEHTKRDKGQRYRFILAQIYQEQGEDELAYENYKKVVRSIPNYEMEFNSRIRMTEVMSGKDSPKAIKKLNKMLRDPKNLEYKGEVYYALGNLYMTRDDKAAAIENYRLSLAFSSDLQKGITSATIAEICYDDKLYQKSQPFYASAAEELPGDYPNIYEYNYRSTILEELVGYYAVMGDMDRTYRLAQMSDSDREAFLENEEEELKREEKIQNLITEAQGETNKELELATDAAPQGDWYFYNDDLVLKGISNFESIWGIRELRDNWRRSAAISFDETEEEEYFDDDEQENQEEEALVSVEDTTVTQVDEEELVIAENKQKAATNKAIVDAYFSLGTVYQYDIQNNEKAIETYEALESQFPDNPHAADSYFAIYNAALDMDDKAKAEEAKAILLSRYPNSNYALILSDPNAKQILLADKAAYNKLYEETFSLFVKGDNHEVLSNSRQLKTAFRDSTLMPKVLLMETLAKGKVAPSEDIRPMLTNIIENYSYDEPVTQQAEVLLAQLGEGKRIIAGGSAANTLSERRNEESEIKRQKILEKQKFKYEPESQHYMVFVLVDSLHTNKNKFQFDLSKFNFNKFMTMDFDLSFMPLNKEITLMLVNGFANETEGDWYKRELMHTNILENYPEITKMYIISEENFRLMTLLGTLMEYEAFKSGL